MIIIVVGGGGGGSVIASVGIIGRGGHELKDLGGLTMVRLVFEFSDSIPELKVGLATREAIAELPQAFLNAGGHGACAAHSTSDREPHSYCTSILPISSPIPS